MFVALVKKYGLIPQEAFPETYQSNNTMESDRLVNAAIRGFAAEVAPLFRKGELRKPAPSKKRRWRRSTISSFPPLACRRRASTSNTRTTRAITSKKGMTPLSFFDKYIGDRNR
jgi:bleomycin hydrolase